MKTNRNTGLTCFALCGAALNYRSVIFSGLAFILLLAEFLRTGQRQQQERQDVHGVAQQPLVMRCRPRQKRRNCVRVLDGHASSSRFLPSRLFLCCREESAAVHALRWGGGLLTRIAPQTHRETGGLQEEGANKRYRQNVRKLVRAAKFRRI